VPELAAAVAGFHLAHLAQLFPRSHRELCLRLVRRPGFRALVQLLCPTVDTMRTSSTRTKAHTPSERARRSQTAPRTAKSPIEQQKAVGRPPAVGQREAARPEGVLGAAELSSVQDF